MQSAKLCLSQLLRRFPSLSARSLVVPHVQMDRIFRAFKHAKMYRDLEP